MTGVQQQRHGQGPLASEDNAAARMSIAGIPVLAVGDEAATGREADGAGDLPLDILTPRAITLEDEGGGGVCTRPYRRAPSTLDILTPRAITLEDEGGGGVCTRPYRRAPSTLLSLADLHPSDLHLSASLPVVKP